MGHVWKRSFGKRSAAIKAGAALGLVSAAAMFLPSTGFALPSITNLSQTARLAANASSLERFTPASVDPALARRVGVQLLALGASARFTPATVDRPSKTVTVAVRLDAPTARVVSVGRAVSVTGQGTIAAGRKAAPTFSATRYDLGAARGLKGFAKPASTLPSGLRETQLSGLSGFNLEDSAEKKDKPARFRTRIALEKEAPAGRTPRSVQGVSDQSVDLRGAYRVTKNLDVTAGVRLSQERDRLDPLTDNVQDSQAVYVGTQLRF